MWFKGARIHPKLKSKHSSNVNTFLDFKYERHMSKVLLGSTFMVKKSHWNQVCGRWAPTWRPWEVTVESHESEAQAALENPWCWRCQSHGITAKKSYMQGVDPAQQREVFVNEKRQSLLSSLICIYSIWFTLFGFHLVLVLDSSLFLEWCMLELWNCFLNFTMGYN